MKKIPFLFVIPFLVVVEVAHSDGTSLGTRHITLKQAMEHALYRSPRLAAMGHQVDADTARLQGREGVPNPELSVEVEDFLGSGVAHGVDSAQITTAVSQDIPLGGKTGAKRRVNEAKQAVSSLERKIAEQVLMADVAAAFLEVLSYQRRLANAEEMVSLAKETIASIEIQVDAGRATAIEVDKAAIVLSMALLDKDRIERNLIVSKQYLASVCGEDGPFFDEVQGTLERIAPLPNFSALKKRIDDHPALLIRSAEVRHQQAILALEKAGRAPDISVSVGYRWINATTDSALVAGVGVTLPFVDRKKGAIGAASHEALRAQKEGDQARVFLFQSLTEAFQLLAAEHKRAHVLMTEVYPKTLSTFEAITEGYRLGRFGYLDLLDAQRTLFEVKEQTLEAIVAYQRTAIALNQTAALSISPLRFEPTVRKEGETR